MKTSILIDTTTASGKKGRKTITDVNPNATNANIKSFAQQLVALTTDTYGSTNKVTTNALQPEDTSTLQDMTVTVAGGSDTIVDGVVTYAYNDTDFTEALRQITVPSDYNGTPILVGKPANAGLSLTKESAQDGIWYWALFYIPDTTSDGIGDFIVRFPADTKYKAKTLTFRVTA